MSERSIFLNALDREDPAARAAYLDAACAGRPELRWRIDRLLRSHQADDTFLEVPAPEQCARAEQSLAFLGPPRAPGAAGALDHYDVLEVVGRGATGVVLKARDTKLQRVVALKVLAPRLAASPAARERFVREAQATAAVRDDHVIAVHAVSDDGPLPYLVMEFIAGVTLEQKIRQGGALELREILRIGLQVASGLAAAHAQGLIHRDIKPANILLENGVQRVKLTDFGLAGAPADAGLAKSGGIAGTPAYMAPCQARGERTSERSDLFSLGAVLYTVCTGRPPFTGETTAAVLRSVCADTPAPIRAARPDLPADLCDLVEKLLAKDPTDRPASAREVANLLSAQLVRAQQPPAPTSAAPRPTRHRPRAGGTRRLILGLALPLCGLAVFAAAWHFWPGPAPDAGVESPPRSDRSPAGPFDLRREDIPPNLLALAGGGDPARAPRELAAVLGDGKFLLPWVGRTSWPEHSPDGRLLAVPLDEDLALFEADTGKLVRTLKGPGGRVVYVTFSRDSGLLAATTWYEGKGGSVRVWDLKADRERFTQPQIGQQISGAAAFSPDGTRLLCEGGGGLDVRDAHSGEALRRVEIPPGGVGSLYFSPDGRRLAVGGWNSRSVHVFDWKGGNLELVRTLKNPRPVGTVVYSPDGKVLAGGDTAGFKLWNADTLEEIRSVTTPAQQLAFAPDGRTLVAAWTVGPPAAVHVFTRWDAASGRELPALSVEVSAERTSAHFCLGRDGKVLFVVPGSKATYVRAVETATGKEAFPRQGHSAPLHAVTVSPDGRTLATAGEDRTVQLWNLAERRVVHSLAAHTGDVVGLAFNHDGRLLASGSRDGTIMLWDVGRGAEVRRLRGHSRSFTRIGFSPDGRTLAAGGENGTVKRWDVGSGRELKPLPAHAGGVRCVAFRPDGTQLASGGEDRTVRLHDLAGGETRRFPATGEVNEVAFSPDGRTLAAVTEDPQAGVQLWDLATGRQVSLAGHTAPVRGQAFAPRAPLLATGDEDGTLRLWDLTGGEAQARVIDLGKGPGGVRAVAFTPDGRYLVTANGNGTVYALRADGPR